jgi:hypothetical protein
MDIGNVNAGAVGMLMHYVNTGRVMKSVCEPSI